MNQYVIYGVIALAFINILSNHSGDIKGLLSRLFTSKTAAVLPAPASVGAGLSDDDLDSQALIRLQKRFGKAQCKEGMDALTICFQHFYHGQEGKS